MFEKSKTLTATADVIFISPVWMAVMLLVEKLTFFNCGKRVGNPIGTLVNALTLKSIVSTGAFGGIKETNLAISLLFLF